MAARRNKYAIQRCPLCGMEVFRDSPAMDIGQEALKCSRCNRVIQNPYRREWRHYPKKGMILFKPLIMAGCGMAGGLVVASSNGALVLISGAIFLFIGLIMFLFDLGKISASRRRTRDPDYLTDMVSAGAITEAERAEWLGQPAAEPKNEEKRLAPAEAPVRAVSAFRPPAKDAAEVGWICPDCGEARAQDDDGCPACRSAKRAIPDWKAPLYAYAADLACHADDAGLSDAIALLTLLDGYRDVHGRLSELHKQRQALYDDLRETIAGSEILDDVRRAIDRLRQLNGYSDSAALIERGEARIGELTILEEQRRQAAAEAARIRKRRRRIALIAALTALVALLIGYFTLVPPARMRRGDEAMVAGDYRAAVNAYTSPCFLFNPQAVREKAGNALRLLTTPMIAEGDYSGAFDALEKKNGKSLGLQDVYDDLYLAWSARLASEGDLKSAEDKLDGIADEAKLAAARVNLGDALMADGNSAHAATLYRLAGSDEKAIDATLARCDQLIAQGMYRSAKTEISSLPDEAQSRDDVRKKRSEIHLGLGDQLMADGDYRHAVEAYTQAGDVDILEAANAAWGRQLLADGRYSDALARFRDAGSVEGLQDTYAAMGLMQIVQGKYTYAARAVAEGLEPEYREAVYDRWIDGLTDDDARLAMLRLIPQSDARDALFGEIVERKVRPAIDAVLSHDANGDKDCDFARRTGAALTDVDVQLAFCRALHDAGYDLAAIYPDGVELKNVPLGQFQVTKIEEDGGTFDLTKLLLFERTENPYDGQKPEVPTDPSEITARLSRAIRGNPDKVDAPRDHFDDNSYSIRLLPGIMFAHAAERVAERYSAATCVALLDHIYWTQKTINTYNGRLFDATDFPCDTAYYCYKAISSLAAYDSAAPGHVGVYDYTIVDPKDADQDWYTHNMFPKKDEDLPVLLLENRVAQFDDKGLRAKLGDFYAMLISPAAAS